MSKLPTAEQIQHDWDTNPRWEGIQRNYSAADVVRLRGTVHIEHSLARLGAEKLWASLHEREFVNALGALTGNQAMQQIKAGLKAIYLSGWQVATPTWLGRCIGPVAVPGRFGAGGGQAHQQHPAACRSAASCRSGRHRLPAADRGRCRGRFWRRAQRLRTDEGDDRGRCGRRALRRPAGLGEERAHGRQVLVPTREAIEKLNAARLAPTCWACRPCWWRAPMPKRLIC